jgi:cardiolipin synthase
MQFVLVVIYILLLIYTAIRILLDTDSTPKTLAYLLLIFIFPLVGVLIYFSFGVNYRHRHSSSKGATAQLEFDKVFYREIKDDTDVQLESHKDEIAHFSPIVSFSPMVSFLKGIGNEFLRYSHIKLLVNGEEKFPEVLKTLETASHFIHMEYYAWENDIRGNEIKDVLLRKVKEGVKVRVLYDDYASRAIRRNIVK